MAKATVAKAALGPNPLPLSCIDKFAYCLRNQEHSPRMA